MPEMNYDKKLRGWTLSQADYADQLLVVTCQLCRTTHRYRPRDILKFRRDTSLARVRFRCEPCRSGDYINVKVQQLEGSDYGTLVVRKLVRVKTVQMPIWEDGTL
ncbi:hypothetical protein DB728_16345 [Rhizobium leguminosarum bv. viciae USDA 2370]|nr:hypothetical protein [Rhizobium leguminosarum]OOO43999.1 hypothetical protein BS629_27910 [Rhizobium leguminosarum bv. viciae USDA 2370]PUB63266.1 hypothetical protein DB728_16345 [Rhizobium leguminosarum bv. viciae USDA 2370]